MIDDSMTSVVAALLAIDEQEPCDHKIGRDNLFINREITTRSHCGSIVLSDCQKACPTDQSGCTRYSNIQVAALRPAPLCGYNNIIPTVK